MTSREAKFILRAHRTDGRYAPDDPVFREALAEAERSPELAAWLAREHALDETVANKIEAIPPPPGLREMILAGARASRRPRPWWRQPAWLTAAAASLALIGTAAIALRLKSVSELNPGAFAHLAMRDYAERGHVHEYAPPLAAMVRELSTRATPLTAGLDLTPAKLRDANCVAVTLDGREAYEVCFERDGVWFHLYVTKLDRAGNPARDRRPVYLQHEQVAAAAWTDGLYLYSVVTRAGPEALAKVVQA